MHYVKSIFFTMSDMFLSAVFLNHLESDLSHSAVSCSGEIRTGSNTFVYLAVQRAAIGRPQSSGSDLILYHL